ncbi:MAG: glycine cleavage system protein H [Gemmatimonadetes bacterium]|nr:glycine cleavage system protein H [Gemmatimonadota bacterium]
MQGLEIFAMKGAEYVFCGAFLLVLVAFWRLLNTPAPSRTVARALPPRRGWFDVPDGFYFHQGHGWVLPEDPRVMRVGIDDFAQKLLGRVSGFELPAVGARVAQGEPAWHIRLDGHEIPMLSPVDGEVIDVNPQVAASPELVNADPYQRGWLLKVKVRNPNAAARNLLSGGLARGWMDGIVENLRGMRAAELGVVLPDGGFPVDGFARALSPERWDDVARTFLLSD